jgi:hypothetical protein
MRPHLNLLCGITNIQGTYADCNINDPRYTSETNIIDLWETQPPIPKEDEEGDWLDIKCGIEDYDAPGGHRNRTNVYQPKYLYELLDFNPEFGVPSVIGYIIDDDCSQAILYALASLYPQVEDEGVMLMESMPLSKDYSEGARYLQRRLTEYDQTIDEFLAETEHAELTYSMNLMLTKARQIKAGQNYKSFMLTFPSYAIVAEYLFKYVGLSVPREDMRLFLHYYWA